VIPTVLVSFDERLAASLRHAAQMRIDGGDIVIECMSGPLALALDEVRHRHGATPLGVAARTPTEAIEAIEAGADESLCLTDPESATVHELVDRTRLRASLRADGEKLKVAIAHTEKLAALGTLVAGVAHEVNNPLAALSLAIEIMPTQIAAASEALEELRAARDDGRGLSSDDVRRISALGEAFGAREELAEQIEEMRSAARSIADVVRDLRVFARADDDEPVQVVAVPEMIDQVLRLVGREISATGHIERDHAADLPDIVVPRSRLTQVLTNVLVNAAHAIREVQREMHRVRITTRADADAVAISVSDTGPGIHPQALERIFDPFFTTKRANLGTGLGLSISRNLMRRMGGDLLVESVYGDGATFVIIVPRATDEAIREAKRRTKSPGARAANAPRLSVLVVDEDEHVLRAYSRVLSKHFDVLLASDGQEAIDMLASGSTADVVLADLALSPHDGAFLHRWLREHRPSLALRTVFVASERDSPRHVRVLGEAPKDVLPKPTPVSLLLEAIDTASRRTLQTDQGRP
jgi:signal transduction histidine kinase/ActR/RegA family two-component response regulator